MDDPFDEPVAPPRFAIVGDKALLLCPMCRSDMVHVDDVFMAGRPREDGDIKVVHVDHRGAVRQGPEVDIPLGPRGIYRRHTISLQGWCEDCKLRFAIALQQDKGQTGVEVLRQEWGTVLEGEEYR